MCINKIANAIFTHGTDSENIEITIYLYYDKDRLVPLWEGKAKDLKDQKYLSDFMVAEILIDNDPKFDHLPDYNKGRIITVI